MHNYKAAAFNMFVARNSYKVASLAYLKQGGLEKHRGGPPRSSNTGETLIYTEICSIGNQPYMLR